MKSAETETNAERNPESGMTMIAVMAMMVLLAMALLAAAPSVQLEVQREKELESIRRGEEIAEAIKEYVVFYRGAKLPNSLDDLLEGLPQGTKKRQILRASAVIDPLSTDVKWLLVKSDPSNVRHWAKAIQAYNNGLLPPNPTPLLDRFTVRDLVNIVNNGNDPSPVEDNFEYEGSTDSTPFIGVVSQSKGKSVISYYGIEDHSKWVFTPLFRGGAGLGGPTRMNTQPNRQPTPFSTPPPANTEQ